MVAGYTHGTARYCKPSFQSYRKEWGLKYIVPQICGGTWKAGGPEPFGPGPTKRVLSSFEPLQIGTCPCLVHLPACGYNQASPEFMLAVVRSSARVIGAVSARRTEFGGLPQEPQAPKRWLRVCLFHVYLQGRRFGLYHAPW